MIDRAASLQPARAPKQQIPLAPCKGRGRFPAHEEDRVCLPSSSVGSILGKATSTTDYWNTVKQTNKQTNKHRRPSAAEPEWSRLQSPLRTRPTPAGLQSAVEADEAAI